MRDGQPALVSRQKNSLVLVSPASRQLQANGRPVYVVGINNLSKRPVDFRVARWRQTSTSAAPTSGCRSLRTKCCSGRKELSGRDGQYSAALRRGKCLQRVTCRLRELYDAEWPQGDILQPNRGGHRTKQRRRTE